MARCSDLPPELIAHIIDFLRNAKFTLRQCSLVCRAWLSPSQRRLFHTFRHFRVNEGAPFRALLSAPHLGTYVREVLILRPVRIFVLDATDRENVQNLFSLLPNITKIRASFLASSPFLFTNSLLRQCPELRKFSILGALDDREVPSPSSIFPSFTGTNVKHLVLRDLRMPCPIDDPLKLNITLCSVERLSLDIMHNLSVWLPFFRKSLPHCNELKITSTLRDIHRWAGVLLTCDLSHLRRLHVCVSIPSRPSRTIPLFPHHDASSFFSFSPRLDHLLLTTRVSRVNLRIEVVFSMVEWYRCTFTALSASDKGTLKELTLTVRALDDSTVAAARAKVDDVLSTNAFSSLERIHFRDKDNIPIKTWSHPNTVSMLEQALLELSRGGKLAV